MLSQKIKKLRKRKGYSLTELARLAGVSKSYLSYIERDLQSNPSLQFLLKIAQPLDTSIEYLLEEENFEELDQEWRALVNTAIKDGMSKKDFREFRDFVKFQKWKQQKEKSKKSEQK